MTESSRSRLEQSAVAASIAESFLEADAEGRNDYSDIRILTMARELVRLHRIFAEATEIQGDDEVLRYVTSGNAVPVTRCTVSADLIRQLLARSESELSIVQRIREAIEHDRCDGDSEWAHGANAACRKHRDMIDEILSAGTGRKAEELTQGEGQLHHPAPECEGEIAARERLEPEGTAGRSGRTERRDGGERPAPISHDKPGETPRTDEYSRQFGPNMCIHIARQLERETVALYEQLLEAKSITPSHVGAQSLREIAEQRSDEKNAAAWSLVNKARRALGLPQIIVNPPRGWTP